MKRIWFVIKFLASFLLSAFAISFLFFSISKEEFTSGHLIASLIFLGIGISPWLVRPSRTIAPKNKFTKAMGTGFEYLLMFIIVLSFFGIVHALGVSVDYILYLVLLTVSIIVVLLPVIAVVYKIKIQRDAAKLARSSAKKSAEINEDMRLMLGQLKSDDANALRSIVESIEEDRAKRIKAEMDNSFIVPFLFMFAMGIAMLILTFFNFK